MENETNSRSYEIMNGTKTPLSSPGEGLKSIVKLFYRLTDFDMALNKQSKGYSDFIQWLGNGRRKLLDPSGSHPVRFLRSSRRLKEATNIRRRSILSLQS